MASDTVSAMSGFDPNAAAAEGSGVFGLPHDADDADLVLVPVPFAATTSYGRGAERGPAAILAASHQVDLFDLQTGRPYERGVHMLEVDDAIAELDRATRVQVEAGAVDAVNAAGAAINDFVQARCRRLIAADKLLGIVGGDHSVPFAAIGAAAEAHGEIGILHIDAHADLRVAYEGFRWSHASIMHNVLAEIPRVVAVAQVGIRDFCEQEHDAILASEGRVRTWFDLDWQRRRGDGERLGSLCSEVCDALPRNVWVSFDIDGLDPQLCPNTGTPVPGGLSFHEACALLETLAEDHRIVGFDLCEVAPGDDGSEWDANVGARVLYKLCGFSLLTN